MACTLLTLTEVWLYICTLLTPTSILKGRDSFGTNVSSRKRSIMAVVPVLAPPNKHTFIDMVYSDYLDLVQYQISVRLHLVTAPLIPKLIPNPFP